MKLTNSPDRGAGCCGDDARAEMRETAPRVPRGPLLEACAKIAGPVTRLLAETYLHKKQTDVAVKRAESRSETVAHLSDAEVAEPKPRSQAVSPAPESTAGPAQHIDELLESEVCQTCRMALEHARGLQPEQQRHALQAYEEYKATQQAYEAGQVPKADMEQATDRLLDSVGL